MLTLLGEILKRSRGVSRWVRRIASLPARNQRDRSYRKCPKCGGPDFRMTDRQRARPVYGSRTYRVKWLCLHCGYETKEYVEERD